ncbi:MAG: hypothetical protein AAFP02_11865, partial [Bacteroidota bacterium]
MKQISLRRALSLLLILVPLIGLAHDVTSADQELLRSGGLWAYIQVGATHINKRDSARRKLICFINSYF